MPMNTDHKIELLKSIDKYIKGELNQDEIDELWIEFLRNPEVFSYFETEIHLQSLVRKGKKPESFGNDGAGKSQSNIRLFKAWFVAAAAAVLIAVGLQFFAMEPNQSGNQLALGSINQTEMIGSDVYRSDEERRSDIDIQINEALAAAYEDETNEAIRKFRALLSQSLDENQQVRVELNLGILLYNQEDYESAVNHFQSVTQIQNVNESFIEKGWWFLGNSLLNIGNIEDAREAVFNAYSMNGRFQNSALALLKKLDQQLHDATE